MLASPARRNTTPITARVWKYNLRGGRRHAARNQVERGHPVNNNINNNNGRSEGAKGCELSVPLGTSHRPAVGLHPQKASVQTDKNNTRERKEAREVPPLNSKLLRKLLRSCAFESTTHRDTENALSISPTSTS